ncbi:cytochrome c5 family protein [Shewanella sp. OPT22]|nr:cytochrome c5 family protein [Shewanella sp. OPT22]
MKKQLAMIAVVASVFSVNAFAAKDGKATYMQACHVCHGTGLAGAPKVHDQKAWKERFDKVSSVPQSGGKKGMDGLVAVALKGKGAMPPKGTCVACNADDLKAAIEFMMGKAK